MTVAVAAHVSQTFQYAQLVSISVVNAGSARTYGAEASVTARVADPLTLNASVGYLNAKYKTFRVAPGNPVIAPFDVAHDGYRFTAPVGNVVISFSDARHDLRTETIRVGPGKNEVELPFAAFVYARVFAVRDGRRVAWPESVLLHAWKDGTNHPYRRSRARGDAVEAAALVKAPHAHRPLDRRTEGTG